MDGRLPRILPRLIRQFTFAVVVICITALGASGAGQMLCLSNCVMHQSAVSTPSCCEGDLEHAGMGAVASGTHSTPLPEAPCCEDTLCFDAPAASAEAAVTIQGLELTLDYPLLMRHLGTPNPVASRAKLSSSLPGSSPPIAIYKRTCVYLI